MARNKWLKDAIDKAKQRPLKTRIAYKIANQNPIGKEGPVSFLSVRKPTDEETILAELIEQEVYEWIKDGKPGAHE